MIRRQSIAFTVPGAPTTNNRATRFYNGIAVHNPESADYEERIQSIARNAVRTSAWITVEMNEAVAVTMVCWNLAGDIDGRTKIAFDALERIVYQNDSVIKRKLIIEKMDWNGPRIDFRFKTIERPCKPARERRMTFADLAKPDYETIVTNHRDGVLNPRPGLIRPMLVAEAPTTWHKKAANALGIAT